MRIKKLHLQNFRGFENLEMTFPETSNLVVLIGKNGSGKSSVLDAIKCALGQITNKITNETHSLSIIHQRKYNTTESSVKCWVSNKEQSHLLESTVKDNVPKTLPQTYKLYVSENNNFITEFAEALVNKDSFPIIGCFPTYSVEKHNSIETNFIYGRKRAFENCFNLNRQGVQELLTWWEEQENIENEKRLEHDEKFRLRSLQTTREAMAVFFNQLENTNLFKDIRVRRRNNELNPDIVESNLMIKKLNEILFFSDLSSGEKAIITIVEEISKRLEIANITTDPISGSGIVLIDEIDQHLHPEWQRKILPALTKTFPNVQFIVTTYSPQVLSSIPKEGVFIIKDGKAFSNGVYTQGRDSNSLLQEAFDIPKHNKELSAKLTAFYGFLDTKNKEQAQKLLDELTDLWGENDVEIVRANLYFQDLLDEINDEVH